MKSKIFSKNISVYAVSNDQTSNGTLTNVIVSFEQLGPRILLFTYAPKTLFSFKIGQHLINELR